MIDQPKATRAATTTPLSTESQRKGANKNPGLKLTDNRNYMVITLLKNPLCDSCVGSAQRMNTERCVCVLVICPQVNLDLIVKMLNKNPQLKKKSDDVFSSRRL